MSWMSLALMPKFPPPENWADVVWRISFLGSNLSFIVVGGGIEDNGSIFKRWLALAFVFVATMFIIEWAYTLQVAATLPIFRNMILIYGAVYLLAYVMYKSNRRRKRRRL